MEPWSVSIAFIDKRYLNNFSKCLFCWHRQLQWPDYTELGKIQYNWEIHDIENPILWLILRCKNKTRNLVSQYLVDRGFSWFLLGYQINFLSIAFHSAAEQLIRLVTMFISNAFLTQAKVLSRSYSEVHKLFRQPFPTNCCAYCICTQANGYS